VSMRAPQAEWAVIDQAAATLGKTRTAFVMDAAKRQAEDVLKDRTLFAFKGAAWDAFVKALDAPINATERKRVAKLMSGKPLWERKA
jgi:uncharacterized protein (DUF1778 family)